ncbi:hypothetical protein [Desulfallas thermosapovorans]|uniref:Uncharacterized protein n=1 Tax=Desulfallas thermosapovorans DSM 6562 TaxID=1121431 RepID=A0A5S4ZPW2_9FIRM|nr:hypothetical protein [Desulfallas thermosapovorans]TYO94757.1 hypothetical protein LX24_02226 [Desulfallas thermosapovorans DSM 6562]
MAKNIEKIKTALLNAAKDGKLSCTAARKLAEELGVAPREIGQMADELKIKIYGCELGCF